MDGRTLLTHKFKVHSHKKGRGHAGYLELNWMPPSDNWIASQFRIVTTIRKTNKKQKNCSSPPINEKNNWIDLDWDN